MAYVKKTWENKPSTASPINANNLNHIEGGIYNNDIHIDNVELYLATVDATVNNLISDKMNKANPTFTGNMTGGANITVTGDYTNGYGETLHGGLASKVNTVNPTGTGFVQLGTGAQASSLFGKDSIAIGTDANAIELNSTAIGHGAEASVPEQIVLGDYNVIDSTSKLIIGGGSDDDNRHTLLKFEDLTGDATFCAEVTDGTGNTLSAKANTTDVIDMLPVDTENGNPCVITDGYSAPAKSLKLTLEPIQDLHGYDKPWIGGSGKNKLDDSYISGFESGGIKVAKYGGMLTVTGTASSAFNQRLATNVPIKAGTYIVSKGSSNTYPQILVSYNNTYIAYVGATEQTITIPSDGTINLDMYINTGSYGDVFKLMIRPSTVADDTFIPYSNICPISGRTQSVLGRYNKYNIFSPLSFTSESKNGITVTYEGNGTYRVKGTSTSSVDFSFLSIPIDPFVIYGGDNREVKFNNTANMPNVRLYFYEEDGTSIDSWGLSPANANNTAYNAMRNKRIGKFLVSIGSALYGTSIDFTFKVEIMDNTNKSSITRTYGTTVYGGTDDATGSGVSVTWGTTTLNGSEGWSASTSGTNYHQYTLSTSTMLYSLGILCDKLPTIQVSDRGTISGIVEYGSDSLIRVSLNDDEYNVTTLSAFETWLSNNNLQIVYQLRNPTSVPLTAQNITLLKGDNVLITDADNIDVEYPADIALYIAKKIAEGISQGNRSLSKGGVSEEEPKEEETKEEEKEVVEIKEEEPLTKEVR